MIEEGALEGIDQVFGMHNVPNFKAGEIRVKEGPMMASICAVKIKILGRGGHSSLPHYFTDVISAGASIITNLHQIKSRHIDSKENFVLTMTQFHGGNANNVFPDDAFIDGTMRCYSNEVFKIAESKITQIAKSTAEMYGCTAEVEYYDYYPAVINDAGVTKDFVRFAEGVVGTEMVSSADLPIAASEDFSYFLENKPGCFFFLGTGNFS